MDKIIEFPHSFEYYLEKGGEAFLTGKFEEAKRFLAKAYDLAPNLDTNLSYFSLLVELGHYQEAVEVANDMKEMYLMIPDFQPLYIYALIQGGHFLEAQQAIHTCMEGAETAEEKSHWQTCLHKLEHHLIDKDSFDQPYSKNIPSKVAIDSSLTGEDQLEERHNQDDLLKKLYELPSYPSLEQLEILKKSCDLKKEKVEPAYKILLLSPYVSEIAKSFILERLKAFGLSESLSALYFNQTISVDLDELELFNHMEQVSKLLDGLEQAFIDQPAEHEMLKNEMILHLFALYPIIDRLITDLDFWLDLYISQFIGDRLYPENPEEERMMACFLCLTKMEF